MKATGDYFVTVIEDTRSNQIIGSATLVIEHKFIHDCGTVLYSNKRLFKFQLIILFSLFSEVDLKMWW